VFKRSGKDDGGGPYDEGPRLGGERRIGIPYGDEPRLVGEPRDGKV